MALGPGSRAGITALILLGGFTKIQLVFKLLCLSLLSYVVVLFVAHVPWTTVGLSTLVPHLTWSKAYLTLLVGVLGTTISPYLFFWQTAGRIEEMRTEDGGGEPVPLERRTTLGAKGKERSSRFDVFTGMTLSNLVMARSSAAWTKRERHALPSRQVTAGNSSKTAHSPLRST